jgi:hypothetical protein
MSALGHKRTFRGAIAMSALPPKADMRGATGDVGYGPIADHSTLPLEFRAAGFDAFSAKSSWTQVQLPRTALRSHLDCQLTAKKRT